MYIKFVLKMFWWWLTPVKCNDDETILSSYSHEMNNKEVCSSLKIIVDYSSSSSTTKWTFSSDKIYV